MSSLITSSPNKQRKNRFTPPQLIEILLIHQSPKFVIEIKKTVVHTGDGRSLPSGVSRTDGDAATPPRPVVPTRAPRHPRVRLPFRRSGNPLEIHRVQTQLRPFFQFASHQKGERHTRRTPKRFAADLQITGRGSPTKTPDRVRGTARFGRRPFAVAQAMVASAKAWPGPRTGRRGAAVICFLCATSQLSDNLQGTSKGYLPGVSIGRCYC